MYSVIILSGGKGSRMAMQLPKQYLLLGGKPIIMHTVERLEFVDEVNEIIIVCENEFVTNLELMMKQYNINKKIVYAPAGKSRQESVYNGIQNVTNNNVIIHEAARPFVLCEEFKKLIEVRSDNVTYGYSIPFTVVKGDNEITSTLDRSELINVQLPQKFKLSTLKRAHDIAQKENKKFTEDSSMVFELCGENVSIIKGSSYNIKITEPIDLHIGEIIYKEYIMGGR